MYPVAFNREELQYETYEMGVWDYWRGDEGDEILEGEEIFDGILSVPVPVSVAPAITLACMSSYTCTV